MKHIFEEYGRVILVVVVTVMLFGLLFARMDILGTLGRVANVDSGLSHQQAATALGHVVERQKPRLEMDDDVSLRLYRNSVFRPLEGITFIDADGAVVANVVVLSIKYCGPDGKLTEFIDHFNKDNNAIVLNMGHRTEGHVCSVAVCSVDGKITNTSDYHLPGAVTVTYRATDMENQVTVETVTFVIDGKVKP